MLRNRFIGLVLLCSAPFAMATDESTIQLCVDMTQQRIGNNATKSQIRVYCECNLPKMEAIAEASYEKGYTPEQTAQLMLSNAEACMKKAGIATNGKAKSSQNSAKASGNTQSTKAKPSAKDSSANQSTAKKRNALEPSKKPGLLVPGLK